MRRAPVFLAFVSMFALLALAGGPSEPEFQAPVSSGRTGPEQARLALSGTFYIEISLGARELRICHSGVAIAAYPLTSVKVGYPRLLWVPRHHLGKWVDDVWRDAHLDPAKVVQRLRIVPGDTSTTPTPEKPGVLPPTLSELTAVPQDYAIRCDDNRAVLLHLEGQIPGAVLDSPGDHPRWRDFLAAIGLKESESIRVRATLSAEDGAAFFRSFPDGRPELLVLP
jgi:hypothetical protein